MKALVHINANELRAKAERIKDDNVGAAVRLATDYIDRSPAIPFFENSSFLPHNPFQSGEEI